MSDYLLANIYVSPNDPVLKQLAETGLRDAAEEVTVQAVNKIGKQALFAFQSAVPYRTGQLQSQHIQITFAQKKNPEVKVYVRDVTHTASKGKEKESSATIADILQRKNFKRSRSSVGVGDFSGGISGTTAGWIDKGFEFLLTELRRDNG